MVRINSVLGPLDTADLGFTLPHEHVCTGSAALPQVFPEFMNREATLARAIRDLTAARAEGVRSFVDLTTFDLGRDVRLVEEAARKSGMQIIVATGTWRDIPRAFSGATPEAIAPLYIREITEGIEGTRIKAGIIKVANDVGGVSPEGEVILRAAARAQKATGVPISTHTWAPERVGEEQVRIFEEEGVDLRRVYIGHSNDTDDLGYLTGLLRRGVWLGMDRFPAGHHPATPKWERRIDVVKRLLDAGFARQLMLSHDWNSSLHAGYAALRLMRDAANPDAFLFITRRVLPALRALGASESDIAALTVDNPRRFFEGS